MSCYTQTKFPMMLVLLESSDSNLDLIIVLYQMFKAHCEAMVEIRDIGMERARLLDEGESSMWKFMSLFS